MPWRYAETPGRPRRLAYESGGTGATPDDGGNGASQWPDFARSATDTSGAGGFGGALPAVSAPEFERLLDRVLGDAARRHGIEV